MSSEFIESCDENSESNSDSESVGNKTPDDSFTAKRKRLSTESSIAVSDDEFGLKRKRSMSVNLTSSPETLRQQSVSSDVNSQGHSPPPTRSDSISSDQEGMGYYSPLPVQLDYEQRKFSISSDTAYYSPPPAASSDNEREYSFLSDVQPSDSEVQEMVDSDCSMSSSKNKQLEVKYYGGAQIESSSSNKAGSSQFSFYHHSKTSVNQHEKFYEHSVSSESVNHAQSVGFKKSELSESDDDDENYAKRQRLDSELSQSSEVSTAPSRKLSTQSESSENNFGLPSYKPSTQKLYSTFAEKIMHKMGYKEGTGLGKMGQGIVEPIQAFKQEGKRGLGLKIPSLNVDTYRWNPDEEVIQLKEEYAWLNGSQLPSLYEEDMESWVQESDKKLSIDNETQFCSPNLLKNILQSKSVFDAMDGDLFFRARNRSNPWEHIKNGPFLNRAAMKMANMDSRFGAMFTNPRAEDGSPLVQPQELLYFADVCAGPGGFSEYVLFKKKWRAKGIGFTLKGQHDFKLDDFFAGPSETFEPFYGTNEDGDIYNPDNITSLYQFVMKSTKGQGVHFMMADGGFSVEGQENIQEILSKRLYLCQFLVSLFIVRPEGSFVCKVFDMFTPFSAGLLYLLYRSYKQVCIFKPNTSRPANSERYIICRWKRTDCESIRDFMFEINKQLDHYKSSSKRDIASCVPLELMTSDDNFFEYLVTSNNTIAEQQIVALAKVRAFYEDQSLTEPRQPQLKKDSFNLWGIPLTARKASSERPEDLFNSITIKDGSWIGDINGKQGMLNSVADLSVVSYACDWHYVVMGSNPLFYLGLGKNAIYRYSKESSRWLPDSSLGIQLSPGTLLYGELVEEYSGSGAAQLKVKAFHIIDAYSLGDRDISAIHYTYRLAECRRFVDSLTHHNNINQRQIRVKKPFDLERLPSDIECIEMVRMKNGSTKLGLDMCDGQTAEATGLILIKATKEPWIRSISRSHQKKYYNNPHTKVSKFDNVPEACASFVECMRKRRVWKWDSGCGMKGDPPSKENPVLHKHELLAHVNKLIAEFTKKKT